MLYEFRTYDLIPRTVPDFEQAFADKLPGRAEFSPLGGLWHTEAGALNQVLHVWPYEDMSERSEVRAKSAAAGAWPPPTSQFVNNMNTEFLTPAPFMKPLGERKIGPVYELRIYKYAPGDVNKVIEAWGNAIEKREEYSPLAGAWFSEVGELNRWFHMWAYESFEHRMEVRAKTRADGVWPPASGVSPIHQQNKLLIPAACSPMQ